MKSITAAIRKQVILPITFSFIGASALLFLSAGSFLFVEGWIFLGTCLIVGVCFFAWLAKKQPAQLMNRIMPQEKSKRQNCLIFAAAIIWCLILTTSGICFRFQRFRMSSWRYVFTICLMAAACYILVNVFKENPYLSKAIEKQDKHMIARSGAYSYIRHPMYLAIVLFNTAIVLILGTFINFVFFPVMVYILVLRIEDEEKFLKENFPEYSNYINAVRYKLLPLIW